MSPEDVKDTQRTESISRFIDQNAVRTNPFGSNRAAERAYRRAERMSAALHMLTAHIHPDEPIRSRLRATASDLLASALDMQGDMRALRSPSVSRMLADVRLAISLVRMATVSGYVSLQNASVMVDALDELGAFIAAAQRTPLAEHMSLTREDLIDVSMAPKAEHVRRTIKRMSDNNGLKDSVPLKDVSSPANTSSPSLRELSVRVQNILDTLRSGGALGIRDIAANLPEYSEKMIQRELLELVSKGKVKKTGLKRWSRYSLGAQ